MVLSAMHDGDTYESPISWLLNALSWLEDISVQMCYGSLVASHRHHASRSVRDIMLHTHKQVHCFEAANRRDVGIGDVHAMIAYMAVWNGVIH